MQVAECKLGPLIPEGPCQEAHSGLKPTRASPTSVLRAICAGATATATATIDLLERRHRRESKNLELSKFKISSKV